MDPQIHEKMPEWLRVLKKAVIEHSRTDRRQKAKAEEHES